MALLIIHIAIGGLIGAVGALVGGLALLSLRIFLTRHIRVRQAEIIREIGIFAALKRALLEVPDRELDFSQRQA